MAVLALEALLVIDVSAAVDFRQSPKITEHAQLAALDAEIELYEIDATALGEGILRYTTSAFARDVVRWGGNPYVPVEIHTEGWQWSGQGTLPTPRFKIGNTGGALTELAEQHDDLIGLKVTRIRTHKRFLDGQPEADDTAHYPLDVFFVERLVGQNKYFMEFELSAAMDQEGRMLPARQMVRDLCDYRYRIFREGSYDYAKATCPYAGGGAFAMDGSATTAELDACGKTLDDCKLRYGNAALPYRGFPLMAKSRA
jgi:lambda family phage minor tail protein L